EAFLRDVALLAAEQVVFVHSAIVEDELRGLARAESHFVFDLADAEARRPLLDDERAMRRAAERRIDRREDDAPRRARAVRDEALATVQDPVFPVSPAARADARDVAPRARLRQRVRGPAELLRHVLEHAEEPLLLRRRAARADRRRAEARARDAHEQRRVAPR